MIDIVKGLVVIAMLVGLSGLVVVGTDTVRAQLSPTVTTVYRQEGPDVKRFEDQDVVCYKWGDDGSSPWCYKK